MRSLWNNLRGTCLKKHESFFSELSCFELCSSLLFFVEGQKYYQMGPRYQYCVVRRVLLLSCPGASHSIKHY